MTQENELIKAIFITNNTGQILLNFVNDKEIQSELLSAFISGLYLFGKESIKKIEEITVKGPDLEVYVVQKHGLILTAIFSSAMKQFNLRNEAEAALDGFYEKYADIIPTWNGDICCFDEFLTLLRTQITEYFKKIQKQEIKPNESKGFWIRLTKKN